MTEVLRWRPRAFLSSSIREYRGLRERIEDAIDALKIAEAWLFETAHQAAGSPPSTQYLQAARDSDVFVILVTPEVRQGTLEEYEAARDDNPAKVLPFVLLPANESTAALRERLREHATIAEVDDERDLPEAVASALRFYVETGEIARRVLRANALDARDGARSRLGVPIGLSWSRYLKPPLAGGPDVLLRSGRRTLLTGPGGNGKTDFTLSAALLTDLLPIYGRVRSDLTTIEGLVNEALAGARFDPGVDLIDRYLRDGRLGLVIDGLDDVEPEVRDEVHASIEAAATRYPRTAIAVVERTDPAGSLISFARVELAGLSPDQVTEVFDRFGHSIHELDPRLAALAEDPFWAVVIAQIGARAVTGLELLAELVRTRLHERLPLSEVARLRTRETLGVLAKSMRPGVEVDLGTALDVVEAWLASGQRYSGITASAVIEDATRSGLVSVAAGRVSFTHPLIAAFLAAEAVVTAEATVRPEEDPDVAALIAGLIDGREPQRIASMLTTPIALSTFLRVTRGTPRPWERDSDLGRFEHAARVLSPSILGGQVEGTEMLAVEGSLCIRRGSASSAITTDQELGAWLGTRPEAICWAGNPLTRMTPERLAAVWALDSFKRAVVAADPGGDPFGPIGRDVRGLAADHEALAARLVAHLLREASTRERLLADLHLDPLQFRAFAGAPKITVLEGDRDVRFEVEWEGSSPSVAFEPANEEVWRGRSVREVEADPRALAYKALVKEIEAAIRSSVSTHSDRGPSSYGWAV
jgi:hypothetical protein